MHGLCLHHEVVDDNNNMSQQIKDHYEENVLILQQTLFFHNYFYSPKKVPTVHTRTHVLTTITCAQVSLLSSVVQF